MIATEIRKKIAEKNMSYTEVAEFCEWSRSGLSNRLKNDRMKESDMEKIAAALGCDLVIKLVDKRGRKKK